MRSVFLPKCKPKITRIFALPYKQGFVVLFWRDFFVSVGSFFDYNPCLFGRAEILVILGLHFRRDDVKYSIDY